jgi:hypothetical protein
LHTKFGEVYPQRKRETKFTCPAFVFLHTFFQLLCRGAPHGPRIPRRGLLERFLAHDPEDVLLHVGDALFHMAVLVLISLLA